MIKMFLKYLMFGVLWGCLWFVVVWIIMDIANPDALHSLIDNFSVQALGSVAVGIGFGTSAIVYKIDRLHLGLQTAIHTTVGLGVYFAVAFGLGWIPMGSPAVIALSLVFCVLLFAAAWCGFYLYGKHEAKKINDKIKGISL